jgi:hypothetical protein
MSLNFAPKPFSTFELVAGSAALAPVALIAFFGLRVPQTQNPSPAEPTSLSTASIPLPRSPVPASNEQLSERSQNVGAAHESPPVDPSSEGDNLVAEPGSANATGSSAVDRPLTAAAWQLGRWRIDGAAGVKQRLIQAGLLWGFADSLGGTASRNAGCGFPSPDAEGSHEVWDQRTQPKPFVTSCDSSSAESRTELSTQGRVAEAAIAPSPPVEQTPPPTRGSRSENTFIGGWADDPGECREGQNHGAPLVISLHAARTASAKCDFRSITPEAASRWHIVAACSREGESWTAHVDLKLTRSILTWSSERGTARYVRCLKS